MPTRAQLLPNRAIEDLGLVEDLGALDCLLFFVSPWPFEFWDVYFLFAFRSIICTLTFGAALTTRAFECHYVGPALILILPTKQITTIIHAQSSSITRSSDTPSQSTSRRPGDRDRRMRLCLFFTYDSHSRTLLPLHSPSPRTVWPGQEAKRPMLYRAASLVGALLVTQAPVALAGYPGGVVSWW